MLVADAQQAVAKADYEKQLEKLKREHSRTKAELSDERYKVAMLEETLDNLQGLTEEIRFKTIHDTLNKAIKRHKEMCHFDKANEARREMQTVANAATTRETSGE
jgi:glutamate mutase epsilon subunit